MLNTDNQESQVINDKKKLEGIKLQENDVAEMIDGVLGNLKSKFTDLSDQILSRIDEMGERMDDLERSLVNLLEETSADDDIKK